MTKDRDGAQGWKQGLKRLVYTEAPTDRGNMRRVLNSLVLHLHPVRAPARAIRFTYTWGLGDLHAALSPVGHHRRAADVPLRARHRARLPQYPGAGGRGRAFAC